MELLNQWPVPIKEELDLIQLNKAVREGYDISEVQVNNVDEKNVKNPFIGVLRSKGFCWLAPSKWNGSENDTWRHGNFFINYCFNSHKIILSYVLFYFPNLLCFSSSIEFNTFVILRYCYVLVPCW